MPGNAETSECLTERVTGQRGPERPRSPEDGKEGTEAGQDVPLLGSRTQTRL